MASGDVSVESALIPSSLNRTALASDFVVADTSFFSYPLVSRPCRTADPIEPVPIKQILSFSTYES